MKWFAAFVLVIACSGIGYCATLGGDNDSAEQKCNDVPCKDSNSVDFKSIGVTAKPVAGKYVCISFKGDITKLIPTLSTTTTTTTTTSKTTHHDGVEESSGLGGVNVNFDEQCALKYDDKKNDLCQLIKDALKDNKDKISDCGVHDANGAYQFSASLPVAAILFVGLYLLQ